MFNRAIQYVFNSIFSSLGRRFYLYSLKKAQKQEDFVKLLEMACEFQSEFCVDYILRHHSNRIPLVIKMVLILKLAEKGDVLNVKRILADCEQDIRQEPQAFAVMNGENCEYFVGLVKFSIMSQNSEMIDLALTKINDLNITPEVLYSILKITSKANSLYAFFKIKQKFPDQFNNAELVNNFFKVSVADGSMIAPYILDLYGPLIHPQMLEKGLILAANKGSSNIIEEIFKKYRDKITEETMLTAYLNAGNLEVLSQLAPSIENLITDEKRYTACANAAKYGRLAVLNYHLAFPGMPEKMTRRNNEILRLARVHGHAEIVERLNQFEPIRNFQPVQDEAGLDQVFNPENAIVPLNNEEKTILQNFINQHQVGQQLDVAAALADLRTFLREQYEANPIKLSTLPFNVEETFQLYYKDEPTTVYRYLFSDPNPLIDHEAEYAIPTDKGFKANISADDYATIANIWAAINHEGTPIPAGFTREQVKTTFINTLAQLARRHNWDKQDRKNVAGEIIEYDDMQGDNPVCPRGIPRQLVDFIKLLKRDHNEEERPLDVRTINEAFYAHVVVGISEKPSIFAKIEQLSLAELIDLKGMIEDEYALLESEEDNDEAKSEDLVLHLEARLPIFSVAGETLNDFKRFCNSYYGETRMQMHHTQSLRWRDNQFNSYLAFIDYLAENLLENYALHICSKITAEINHKTPCSKAITYQAPNSQGTKGTKRKTPYVAHSGSEFESDSDSESEAEMDPQSEKPLLFKRARH